MQAARGQKEMERNVSWEMISKRHSYFWRLESAFNKLSYVNLNKHASFISPVWVAGEVHWILGEEITHCLLMEHSPTWELCLDALWCRQVTYIRYPAMPNGANAMEIHRFSSIWGHIRQAAFSERDFKMPTLEEDWRIHNWLLAFSFPPLHNFMFLVI